MSKFNAGDKVSILDEHRHYYNGLGEDISSLGEVECISKSVSRVIFNEKRELCLNWHLVKLNVVDTPQKDLTTLDVPFGELDRDTQLRLVNHVLDGGIIQTTITSHKMWVNVVGVPTGDLSIYASRKYRAVAKQPEQPTERETLESKLHEQWVELNATMKRITEIK